MREIDEDLNTLQVFGAIRLLFDVRSANSLPIMVATYVNDSAMSNKALTEGRQQTAIVMT